MLTSMRGGRSPAGQSKIFFLGKIGSQNETPLQIRRSSLVLILAESKSFRKINEFSKTSDMKVFRIFKVNVDLGS